MSDYADDPFKSMARKYDAKIVGRGGSSIFAMRGPSAAPYVPRVYPSSHGQRSQRRWDGEELERLRIAYEGDVKLEAIAADFDIAHGNIIRLAHRHGWKLRQETRRGAKAQPARLVGVTLGGILADSP